MSFSTNSFKGNEEPNAAETIDQTTSDIPGAPSVSFDAYVAKVGAAQALMMICVGVVVLAVLKNVTTYLAMYSLATIRTGVIRDLRKTTYSKLLRRI